MSPPWQRWLAAAAVSLGVIAVAFGIAPRACERGLDVYVESGVAAAVLMAAIPFIVRTGDSIRRRVGLSLAFVCLVLAAWVAGLFAADVRIWCRLF
jgi:hypothetical protein